ncbi:biotin transporter BioY [Cohnella pontilimi]|uniref:Biotin transporter n=1 Tax=Cohnella pontilimi TaxID=2564100 RepID=A0A4U0FE42_9BACL|nr:biotin transporter BioY [Cohnella pontilimi]TJY43081.1 biotin transporter BioY [Cohnella pontilimi]
MSTQSPVSSPSPQSSAAASSQWIRGIVFTALFSALFITGSFVKVNLGFTVPFSLQTFAVMLAGGFLGAAYGFWSIFIVVALTTLGLPLMNGAGGFAQVFGPTGGYIWMFPVAAFLVGWASDRLFTGRSRLNPVRIVLLLLAVFVFGVMLVYVTGVPWLAHVSEKLDFQGAVEFGMVKFLLGDTIKAVAATLVIAALRPVLPAIRPSK